MRYPLVWYINLFKGFYLLLKYVFPLNMAFNQDFKADSIYGIYYKASKMTIFIFILWFKM